MEPKDFTVIGHIGDLLVDIYTAKCDAYLHFNAVLNEGGEDAQSRRNDCSILAVTMPNLTRNTQQNFVISDSEPEHPRSHGISLGIYVNQISHMSSEKSEIYKG